MWHLMLALLGASRRPAVLVAVPPPPSPPRQEIAVANLCVAAATGLMLDDWAAGVLAAALLFALSHTTPHEAMPLAIW